MTDAEKKPREFWIVDHSWITENKPCTYNAVETHVIEHSAFQEAKEKIKHLEARVEKLRTALEKLTKVDTWFYYYDKDRLDNSPPIMVSTLARAALKEDEGMR